MHDHNPSLYFHWLYLFGPLVFALIFNLREYGVRQSLNHFRGLHLCCLLGPLLLTGQAYIYYQYGEAWFCGLCRKGAGPEFLIPGLVYPLLTFPAYFANRLFDSLEEKSVEILVFLFGLIGYSFFVMGVLSSR